MNPGQLRTAPLAAKGGQPLREGLRFVWRDPVLRSTFIILTIVSTFAFNYGVSLLLRGLPEPRRRRGRASACCSP